jgi:cyclase
MLKKRVVATLVVRDNIVVQSINFGKYLPVGKPEIAVDFLNQWGIDEIIFLDINASKLGTGPNFELIKNIAKKCFVPLTIGGGVNNINQINKLLKFGADKVSLNSILLKDINFVKKASMIFGNQCIVASVDVIKVGEQYEVYDYLNSTSSKINVLDFVLQLEQAGIGEICINSVDRDGSYKGYDLDLVNSVVEISNVPIIISGGAKTPYDFIDVFNSTDVNGASAANFFHFYEHSVTLTKSVLNREIPIRIETNFNYNESTFSSNYRLLKKEDFILENMLFHKITKEII